MAIASTPRITRWASRLSGPQGRRLGFCIGPEGGIILVLILSPIADIMPLEDIMPLADDAIGEGLRGLARRA